MQKNEVTGAGNITQKTIQKLWLQFYLFCNYLNNNVFNTFTLEMFLILDLTITWSPFWIYENDEIEENNPISNPTNPLPYVH